MQPTLNQALDTYLQKYYKSHSAGAALLVANGAGVLYEGCMGLADLGTGEKITSTTNFRLASVSKQFTAMAIQLLEQQKLLKYTDLLSLFFPELTALCHGVTLKHLITHTSGLPDYENFVDENRTTQVKDTEVLEIIAEQKVLLFAPGTQYRYSNTGYVLLALVVEKVTGFAFADFMKQHFFKPLGMHHTVLYDKGIQIPGRAMGYALNEAGELVLSDQSTCSATKGDGCIYTSLHDYLMWHQTLQQNNRFSLAETLPSISTTIDGNPHAFYGMGWFFAKRSNNTYELYHTGNTCGFSNLVIRIPERGLLVACFTNIADNLYLVGALVDVLQQYPETRLESGLIRRLLDLTR